MLCYRQSKFSQLVLIEMSIRQYVDIAISNFYITEDDDLVGNLVHVCGEFYILKSIFYVVM